jgi:hypothetical protein
LLLLLHCFRLVGIGESRAGIGHHIGVRKQSSEDTGALTLIGLLNSGWWLMQTAKPLTNVRPSNGIVVATMHFRFTQILLAYRV